MTKKKDIKDEIPNKEKSSANLKHVDSKFNVVNLQHKVDNNAIWQATYLII